ncbi:MAG: hypothetical protein ACRDH6_03310 [Actinomycetota bacterium]
MELGTILIGTFVVSGVGLVLGWMGNGRFNKVERALETLDRKIGPGYAEVANRIGHLESEVTALDRKIGPGYVEVASRMGRLETEVTALRSDVTQIALAVGARRPQASSE